MTEEIKSPIKAIRAKCLDCVCGSEAEVRKCPVVDCSLWPFRFGRNPFHARSREQRQKTEAEASGE